MPVLLADHDLAGRLRRPATGVPGWTLATAQSSGRRLLAAPKIGAAISVDTDTLRAGVMDCGSPFIDTARSRDLAKVTRLRMSGLIFQAPERPARYPDGRCLSACYSDDTFLVHLLLASGSATVRLRCDQLGLSELMPCDDVGDAEIRTMHPDEL